MNISVIIPVFNAEKYVRKAVESALLLEEVKEVLLIEDGSPDNALAVCQQLTQENNRVKLFRHPNGKNRGASASRNLGLQNASQDFIAFLDADDFYLPNRFEKDEIVFAEKTDADGVINATGTHFYSEKGKEDYLGRNENPLTTYSRPDLSPDNYFETIMLYQGFSHLNGLTLKVSALNKTPTFDLSLKQAQDRDFILSLALNCKIYPSSMLEPVTIRGVHDSNRIHNVTEAKNFEGMLYLKWLKKAQHQNWSKDIVYRIFYRAVLGAATSESTRRITALKIIASHLFILKKASVRDLLSGIKSNFA